MNRNILTLFVLSFFVSLHAGVAAEEGALAPAIKKLSIRLSEPAFGKWNEPREIRSAEDAAKHFDGDALTKLTESVDFEKQIVLVFAWRGSGRDKLDFVVMESFPEQIAFSRQPGLTRDLRPHVHVYALRSNVKWSVRGKR